MSYEAIIYTDRVDNAKPHREFEIEYVSDVASLPTTTCAPGSLAYLPNGERYKFSAGGAWTFDVSTYAGAADVLGDMPHTLHVTEGENSNLACAIGATPKTDGALLYNGDALTITYSGDTGYTAACTVNGTAAGESPATHNVGVGEDVDVVTTAAIKTYDLTLTEGDNTTLTVTSGSGDDLVTYADGDTIPHFTELTITAEADTGYSVSTFTVNTVDKTGSNPDTHTVEAAIAVVSAATLNSYVLTLTQGENTTLTALDGEAPVLTGASVDHGTVLTITAAAGEGHDLTTFTVGGADKLEDNPYEHTMTAAVTVVTAATEQ